ncbi:MAG: tetratricopeptide repeat protein [Thermoanaerobaculia bacterium]|nr:tetratricopeptide repeat protein [Thermoanaerobaculia bacterium]
MNRPTSSCLSFVCGLALLCSLAGFTTPSAAESEPVAEAPVAPEPLPDPDLTGMEPAVQELLTGERQSLQRLTERDDADRLLLADAWGEMGFVYHAHGLLDSAASCYRNAESLAPADFRWPHSLGALERERSRLEEAREALDRTLTLVPNDLPAILYLGDVQLSLGDIEAAAEASRKALQISDSSPAVLNLAGRVAMHQGRPADAVKHFDFAMRQVPGADRLQYELGMAYRALGDLDKAREHLAKAGKIGVKPPDRLLDMIDSQKTGERLLLLEGRRAFNAGDYAAAAEAFQTAVDAEPESLRARVNLASALAYSGSAVEAADELIYVLERDPEHHSALYNLGAIHRSAGNHDKAIALLSSALKQDEEDDGVRYELGLAYRGAGDLDAAAKHLERVADGRALDAPAQHTYGDTLARLGRYQEAFEVLRDAYQLQPEDGLLAHGLARLLAACPDPSIRNGPVAVDLATRVVEASPSIGHLETLALALAESGRCAEAAEVQRQIVAMPGMKPAGIAKYSVVAQRYAEGPPCRPEVDPSLAAAAEPDTEDETQESAEGNGDR